MPFSSQRFPSRASIRALCLLVSCSCATVDEDTNEAGSEDTTGTETPGPGQYYRFPFVDAWDEVLSLPAASLTYLSVGDRISSDNYANRGDIEVRYLPGIDTVTVDMQRFTFAEDVDEATRNFERMYLWAYSLALPEEPSEANAVARCDAPGGPPERCYIRAYYDGLFQPSRDGANFRLTLPQAWGGELELVSSDNLAEAETYPDRSDILVDGLAGKLLVDLDTGEVDLRLDPQLPHYAGCPASQACEDTGHAMDCGCTTPTLISVASAAGQAANITVDLGADENWYTVQLETREPGCSASLECGALSSCELDPAYAEDPTQERAELNFPANGLATLGAGIRLALTSDACAELPYVDGPEDFDSDTLPVERRGDIRVCVGCLDGL